VSPARRGRPLRLGLTGNIACGKSTVLRMLADLGAATFDADAVYHELLAPGGPLAAAVAARFGPGVVTTGGGIDRRALGAIVFADPLALADLEALTHPAVVAEIEDRAARSEAPVVVIDAVKLVESGLADRCDRLWVVVCDPEQQVERLMRRNALSREEAERRVAAQPDPAPKLARADVVLDNSGDLAATRAQVEAAWRALCDEKGGTARSRAPSGRDTERREVDRP
jgi:dephospho-CoA kinase